MTPAAIFSLVKDAVILIALGLVAYFLINYGKDIVKVSDMKALQQQITTNTQTLERWQKESTDADTKRQTDLGNIASTIANQRAPVFVRSGPACSSPVPNSSPSTSNQPSKPTGSDQGNGVDYRPIINQFESKYSTALVECYSALDKWPH
jgi:hypothetical protein